jgi:hypothetical protein
MSDQRGDSERAPSEFKKKKLEVTFYFQIVSLFSLSLMKAIGQKWTGKSGKKPSVKNLIRSLKRLLSKPDLPEDLRAAKQAHLDRLEQKSTHSTIVRKELTIASRYHKIKFFERRKIERRIKQAERKLAALRNGQTVITSKKTDSGDDESDGEAEPLTVESAEQQLQKWQRDLDYVTLYPKGLKYVALFPKSESAEAQAHSDSQRASIRELIATAKSLSTSAGTLLAAAGKLSDKKNNISDKSVASVAPSSAFSQAAVRFQALAASFVSSGMQIDEDSEDEEDQKPDDGELGRRTTATHQSDSDNDSEMEGDDFFLSEDADAKPHKRKRDDTDEQQHKHARINQAPKTYNRSFGAASKFLQHDKSDRYVSYFELM